MNVTTYHYATSPLGRLHYAQCGTGPLLLLLHQTPRSHDEFRELLPLLGARFRAVAMDMVGFGASEKLAGPQTIEQYALGARTLLDCLGEREAVIMGHHTGAAVAIEVAASAPERVVALVLSSPPWADGAYRTRHSAQPAVDVAVQQTNGKHLLKLWASRMPFYPEPGSADLLDRYIRDALAPGLDPAEGHRACGRYVMEDRIGLITAPVLLLAAGQDPFALPHIDHVAAHLENAKSVRRNLVTAGTVAMMEQCAPEVAVAVLDFLS